jgi:hypothetical protein
MMPRFSPRQPASWFSFILWMAVPLTMTSPVVGRSMPVIMLSRVDLPLPDLPMMLTNSPPDAQVDLLERLVIAGCTLVIFIHAAQVDHRHICGLVFFVSKLLKRVKWTWYSSNKEFPPLSLYSGGNKRSI